MVGAEHSTFEILKNCFTPERMGGLDYILKFADSPDKVDPNDLPNPGVVALFDAFSLTSPGFEGVKTLRSRGFQGRVFLFGEPALEMAIDPFKTLKLSGFFPSFDQVDLSFASGVIHHQLYYDGDINLNGFLQKGGRGSSEVIHNFKEFSSFGVKLATFLGKFGIDLIQLKRLLMGLTLPHIKSHSGSPQVEQPFTVFYGIDKKKVILATTTFSRGSNKENLLNDFCEMLLGLKASKAPQGTIFPEFSHTAKAAENLVLFSGSTFETQPPLDPITMLTFLPFPKSPGEKVNPQHIFGFCMVSRTPEYEEFNPEAELPSDLGPQSTPEESSQPPNEINSENPDAEKTSFQADQASLESLMTPTAEAPASEPQDITSILNDTMQVIGDVPREVDPHASTPEPPAPVVVTQTTNTIAPATENTVGIVETRVNVVEEEEYLKLKELVASLSQDVRRLMKERRTPSTDKELRESYTTIEERIKKVNAEKMKLEDEITEKNKLIEILKAQVETLSRNKVA